MRSIVGIAGALAVLTSTASAQALGAWEQFDFAHRRVDSREIAKLSLPALRSLRGIVFGRHGRSFKDEPDVRAYLQTRSWYRADTAFTNRRLNAMERANLDVIREMEARKHKQIETGDMRF